MATKNITPTDIQFKQQQQIGILQLIYFEDANDCKQSRIILTMKNLKLDTFWHDYCSSKSNKIKKKLFDNKSVIFKNDNSNLLINGSWYLTLKKEIVELTINSVDRRGNWNVKYFKSYVDDCVIDIFVEFAKIIECAIDNTFYICKKELLTNIVQVQVLYKPNQNSFIEPINLIQDEIVVCDENKHAVFIKTCSVQTQRIDNGHRQIIKKKSTCELI